MSNRVGIVFDIETIADPAVVRELGTDEKIARLDGKDVEALRQVAAIHDVALGNLKNPDPIRKKIADYFRAQRDKAALKAHSSKICTIAARPVAGALDDIEAWKREGDLLGVDWPGYVWTVDENRDEPAVIRGFFNYLETFGEDVLLMGFNIRGGGSWRKGFDIPTLRLRCAMLGIPWPHWLPHTLAEDRVSKRLFDVCDVVPEGGANEWLRAAGLPPKIATGADVAGMTPQERAIYCSNDVEGERWLLGLVLPTQAPHLHDLLFDPVQA